MFGQFSIIFVNDHSEIDYVVCVYVFKTNYYVPTKSSWVELFYSKVTSITDDAAKGCETYIWMKRNSKDDLDCFICGKRSS